MQIITDLEFISPMYTYNLGKFIKAMDTHTLSVSVKVIYTFDISLSAKNSNSSECSFQRME